MVAYFDCSRAGDGRGGALPPARLRRPHPEVISGNKGRRAAAGATGDRGRAAGRSTINEAALTDAMLHATGQSGRGWPTCPGSTVIARPDQPRTAKGWSVSGTTDSPAEEDRPRGSMPRASAPYPQGRPFSGTSWTAGQPAAVARLRSNHYNHVGRSGAVSVGDGRGCSKGVTGRADRGWARRAHPNRRRCGHPRCNRRDSWCFSDLSSPLVAPPAPTTPNSCLDPLRAEHRPGQATLSPAAKEADGRYRHHASITTNGKIDPIVHP